MTATEAEWMADNDFRLYLDARFEAMRSDLREVALGINTRLDGLNGRVGKTETRLMEIERRDAYQEGQSHALEGRIQPSKDGERKAGDEELRISVTPRMWAALITVGSVVGSILHFVFDVWWTR